MNPINGLDFLLAAPSFPGEPAAPRAVEAELVLTRKIVNRSPVALAGDEPRVGDQVYAWTQVAGVAAGFVEHVWFRDGEEIARHYLPVGPGRRWRTWTRHKVGPGQWRVELLGPHGELLRELAFCVEGRA